VLFGLGGIFIERFKKLKMLTNVITPTDYWSTCQYYRTIAR